MIKAFVRYCPHVVSRYVAASYFKIGSLLSGGFGQFHSSPVSINMGDMKIKILPALKDNYMYLIIDEHTKEAVAVDPVEPSKVITAAKEENAILTTVLTTHHHWDHAGGNKEILKMCPDLEIIGGDDRIDGLTRKVKHNERIHIGELTVVSLFTPCHTKGHMCYYFPQNSKPPVVFTGDTLFTAGCGRFFEGTPSEMYRALIEVLGTLPDETEVYSGHEYGLNNLNFARCVEPRNPYVKKRLDWALTQRKNNQPTVPSTIGEEKKTNPFMRVHQIEMLRAFKNSDPVSVMGLLREKKDEFTG